MMKKIVPVLVLIALVAGIALWKNSSERSDIISEVQAPENEPANTEEKVVRAPVVLTAKQSYSPETISKLKILNEVFASRNDNDPRLDSEFAELTPELKTALIESYRLMPKESLNERGTVVFLLGKKIESEKDVEFLQEVMTETPCLSLSDCSTESRLENPEDDHLSESQETTLIYPQLMALRLMSSNYQESKNSSVKEKIKEVFQLATQSPSEYISNEAERIAHDAGISLII